MLNKPITPASTTGSLHIVNQIKNRLFVVHIEEYPICLYLLFTDKIQTGGALSYDKPEYEVVLSDGRLIHCYLDRRR
ncbi:MAG: hypothetical protein A2Z38_01890 [Planctomycetes bacterium RBG_19FT_COMBO_48_8]|nr:MAG: hypothetical protein A2Z38_01890 [Planctomycetes bacterium RBG_19FT_COMBO_48_8]